MVVQKYRPLVTATVFLPITAKWLFVANYWANMLIFWHNNESFLNCCNQIYQAIWITGVECRRRNTIPLEYTTWGTCLPATAFLCHTLLLSAILATSEGVPNVKVILLQRVAQMSLTQMICQHTNGLSAISMQTNYLPVGFSTALLNNTKRLV